MIVIRQNFYLVADYLENKGKHSLVEMLIGLLNINRSKLEKKIILLKENTITDVKTKGLL